MIVDALILAGGRSSRLGGTAKSRFSLAGQTLLQRTVQAVADAGVRRTVIVGDEGTDAVVAIREEPAYAGPVAAIEAGLRALPGDSEAVLVLACDMPGIADALRPLLAGGPSEGASAAGAIAVDNGRRQQLAIVVRPAALEAALGGLTTVVDASMRDLLAGLDLIEVAVPRGSTDDIDTWDDVARFGAAAPQSTGSTA